MKIEQNLAGTAEQEARLLFVWSDAQTAWEFWDKTQGCRDPAKPSRLV